MSSTTSTVSDTPSDESETTPQEQASAIPQVTKWLETLDLNAMAPGSSTTGSANGGGTRGSGTKVGAPIEFTGSKAQVEPFILQCQLVFAMDSDRYPTNAKQVLYVISYMKGPAFEFVQPHLKDYLEQGTNSKATTKAMLGSRTTLFEEIRSTFGYGNELQEAERAIQGTRQRGSAAKYKAEFQILSAKLNWNDEAIAAQFYQGLKDNVKDEIARGDRPTKFKDMAEMAIRIDTRIWERQLERKGNFQSNPAGANRKAHRDVPEWKNNYYGLQKMQLDATKGKPGPNGNRRGKPVLTQGYKKKPFDKTNCMCHNCGQKGHFARDCRSRKQRHELQGTTPRTIAATKQIDHASLSWTACYEDSCTIHQGDKDGSGWWPKEPKAHRMCVLRITPPETEEDTGTDSGEDSEESSEDEGQGSTLALESNDLLEFAIEGHGEALQMFKEIARRYEEVFPRVGNKRYLHPHQFELFLQRLRAMFWGHRLVDVEYDHAMIIHEYPPLGSVFSHGGYTTPDGILVDNRMRQMVTQLKIHYRTEKGLKTLRSHIRNEEVPNQQAWAEQQRHNREILQRMKNFQQQAGDTRLFTANSWRQSSRREPQPLLPPVLESLDTGRELSDTEEGSGNE